MTLNAIGLSLLPCFFATAAVNGEAWLCAVPARRVFHSMSSDSLRQGRYACYQTNTSMERHRVQGLLGKSTYLVVLQSYCKQSDWEVVLFPFFFFFFSLAYPFVGIKHWSPQPVTQTHHYLSHRSVNLTTNNSPCTPPWKKKKKSGTSVFPKSFLSHCFVLVYKKY